MELVTIDGDSGVGKTTLGRALADRLRIPFWDTGLTYRALACAWKVLGRDLPPSALIARLTAIPYLTGRPEERLLDGQSLDSALWAPDLSELLFAVASDASCRSVLREFHQRIISPPAVVAGRDIGSTVFPSAAVKVVLLASDEVRRRRRQLQDADGLVRTPPEPESLREIWNRHGLGESVIRIDTDALTADEVLLRVIGAANAAWIGGRDD